MASAIPPVLVELQLETANIKAQMQQLNKNFSEFGETVKRQTGPLQSFKTAALGVFGGNLLLKGVQMFASGVRSTIADAQDFQRVTAQLEAGIKSTGNVASLSVASLKEHASALESISAVDDNLIMQSQAVFQTFTNVRNVVGEGNDIFNQASAAALDLSTKMQGDLQGATVQLGKALNDPIKGITALTRVGVVFTASQKEQIKALMESGDVMGAQKIILAEMNTEFGGAAKAAGDTFAGAVFRAKDKLEDFGRSIVIGLQPILLKIGKTLGDIINKYILPFIKFLDKNKEAIATFVTVIGTAIVAFKIYKGIIIATQTVQELYIVALALLKGAKLGDIVATNAQTAAMLRLNGVIKMNPYAKIVIAIALVAAAFVAAWKNSETFRAIVVKGIQIVLNGIGYLVGGIAKLIGAFAKIPGMGWAKGIADGAAKAANDIRKVSDGLDSLVKKEVKYDPLGGVKTKGTEGSAAAPKGGLTAEQIRNAKAAAKARAKEIAKTQEDATKAASAALKQQAKDLLGAINDAEDNYAKQNKVISEAQDKGLELKEEYRQIIFKLDAKFQKETLETQKDFANKEVEIRKSFTEKAFQLEIDAANKRASIIQKSKDLLINAFASATKIDLASLVKDSDGTGVTIVQKLKEKYEKIMILQKRAGELANKGFSQLFIQDVISQGTDAGTAMADQILASTPETITEMKTLFNKIQDVSQNGMDNLADQIYSGLGLATQALKEEYAQVSVDLHNSLLKNSEELAAALTKNKEDLSDALLKIQTGFQDSLLEAEQAYNEAIDRLAKDTKDKLVALQDELKKVAELMKQLGQGNLAVQTMANSPGAGYLAGTKSDNSLFGPSSTGSVTNFTSNITGVNLSNPQATADAMANGFRFGQAQSLTPKSNFTFNSGNPLAVK